MITHQNKYRTHIHTWLYSYFGYMQNDLLNTSVRKHVYGVRVKINKKSDEITDATFYYLY